MQKKSLGEEPQELPRQHRALPKSCFSITLCTPVLPVWPLLNQHQLPGLLYLQPGVGSGRESRESHEAAGHNWKNSSRVFVCLCGERVRQVKPNLA